MPRCSAALGLALSFLFLQVLACGSASAPAPLSTDRVNLVFMSSEDLFDHAPGDIDSATASLTAQGLQRSLKMAIFLKERVLGSANVNRIYALQPMSHVQQGVPDMVALGSIQQFAMLNQLTLTAAGGSASPLFTANSASINVSYRPDAGLPRNVVSPLGTPPLDVGTPPALAPCPGCQGLAFDDRAGNLALVLGIIATGAPGAFVFSAPWSTISALLQDLGAQPGLGLTAPTTFPGPNVVHAVSIGTSGAATLTTYDSHLDPPSTYPVLPAAVPSAACPGNDTPITLFTLQARAGDPGVALPAGINTDETVYLVRHAEAHPVRGWEAGNFVAAGQWRALALATTLQGKIDPTQIWSIDPAQVAPGAMVSGNSSASYVRPSLTAWPYAIARQMPVYLVHELELAAPTSPQSTSAKFFRGGAFSGQRVFLTWEHNHFPPIVDELLGSYFPDGGAPVAPGWPDDDYDTIWTVTLDAAGSVTVTNALCEGIDSSRLPATAPGF